MYACVFVWWNSTRGRSWKIVATISEEKLRWMTSWLSKVLWRAGDAASRWSARQQNDDEVNRRERSFFLHTIKLRTIRQYSQIRNMREVSKAARAPVHQSTFGKFHLQREYTRHVKSGNLKYGGVSTKHERAQSWIWGQCMRVPNKPNPKFENI